MKFLLFGVVFALLMGGCAYKNEAIALVSYKAEYGGPISQENKKVYVKLVKDMRKDKRSIGYYLQDGAKAARLYSTVNFEEKYNEGLGYALNIAGFDTETNLNTAALVVEVYIKDIAITYNDKTFDQNLVGSIEIEVVIRKGREVIKQNFRQKGGTWIKPSYTSKDTEPFLYSLFSDSINDIVSRLTRL